MIEIIGLSTNDLSFYGENADIIQHLDPELNQPEVTPVISNDSNDANPYPNHLTVNTIDLLKDPA